MTNRVDKSMRDDIVTERGTVSGTGKALSDEEALRILDERIEPTPAPETTPDIGVVIDPEAPEKPRNLSPQEAEAIRAGHGGHSAQRKTVHFTQGMLAPEMSRSLWMARHETPLSLILERSGGYVTLAGSPYPYLETPLVLRILYEDSMIDVVLSPDDVRKNPSLSDLIGKSRKSRHFRI